VAPRNPHLARFTNGVGQTAVLSEPRHASQWQDGRHPPEPHLFTQCPLRQYREVRDSAVWSDAYQVKLRNRSAVPLPFPAWCHPDGASVWLGSEGRGSTSSHDTDAWQRIRRGSDSCGECVLSCHLCPSTAEVDNGIVVKRSATKQTPYGGQHARHSYQSDKRSVYAAPLHSHLTRRAWFPP
jgi:hypothetical protein